MFENREFVLNFRKKAKPSATEETPKKDIDIVAIADEIGSHILVGFLVAAGVVTALVTSACVIVNATNPANH